MIGHRPGALAIAMLLVATLLLGVGTTLAQGVPAPVDGPPSTTVPGTPPPPPATPPAEEPTPPIACPPDARSTVVARTAALVPVPGLTLADDELPLPKDAQDRGFDIKEKKGVYRLGALTGKGSLWIVNGRVEDACPPPLKVTIYEGVVKDGKVTRGKEIAKGDLTAKPPPSVPVGGINLPGIGLPGPWDKERVVWIEVETTAKDWKVNPYPARQPE